jgi:uncharacterized protein
MLSGLMRTIPVAGDYRPVFEALLQATRRAVEQHYGDRLISLAVFGSVGRGTPRPDSDLDLLLVVSGLPDGRMRRVEDFEIVEECLTLELAAAAKQGVFASLSPVFKTPAEAAAGSPLLLDMIDDARVLVDRDEFLNGVLARLRARLEQLGARRIWRGNAWFWDLKPDYRPGEEFEL